MVGERWVHVSCSVSRLVGSGVWRLLRLRDQGRLLRGGSAELSPTSGKILLERRREMKFQKDEQMDKGLEAWKPCGSLSWRGSWKVRPGRAVEQVMQGLRCQLGLGFHPTETQEGGIPGEARVHPCSQEQGGHWGKIQIPSPSPVLQPSLHAAGAPCLLSQHGSGQTGISGP